MFALLGKIERFTRIIATFKVFIAAFNLTQRWYDRKTYWTITVEPNTELYRIMHDEVFPYSEIPPRYADAALLDVYLYDADYSSGDLAKREVGLVNSATAKTKINVKGHLVEVRLEAKNQPTRYQSNETNSNQGIEGAEKALAELVSNFDKNNVMRFYARTLKGQNAVREYMTETAMKRSQTRTEPHLYITGNNFGSGWTEIKSQPPRKLSSVVLPDTDLEDLVANVQTFIDSEQYYIERGMPYHHGIVLEGPPGTGKTSIVRALSNHLGLNLYSLSLSEVSSDSVFLKLLANIDSKSILLLEDADVFNATKMREGDDKNRLTLSGLLNGLDGVATPHGLITVMTTNRFDALDSALIRSGRVGMRLHVGNLTGDQANRMAKWFYADPSLNLEITNEMVQDMSPAKFTDLMRENPLPQMVPVWLSYRSVIKDSVDF